LAEPPISRASSLPQLFCGVFGIVDHSWPE
jgi:hypothetical protein